MKMRIFPDSRGYNRRLKRVQSSIKEGTIPHYTLHSTPYPLLFILLFLLSTTLCLSQEIRELWVPADQLETILKKKPRAVFLTPQQYNSLALDAQKAVFIAESDLVDPPVKGVVHSVDMTGKIQPGADVVAVTAEYEVESFTKDWTEIPLVMPLRTLGHIEIDDESAIRTLNANQPMLLTRGKGKHKVKAIFHLPVSRSAGGESIEIHGPGIPAAKLSLSVPEGTKLESDLPFHISEGQAQCTVPANPEGCFKIEWAARKVAAIPGAAVFQTCSYLYNIDSARLQADLGMVINSSLADLPTAFTIDLPENVRVLSVEGAELRRWDRKPNGGVDVKLLPGERDAADIRMRVELDVPEAGDANEMSLTLPIAKIANIHRASGTMTVFGSDDVRIKQIMTGPLTIPIPDDAEGPSANLPNYVASFQFPVQRDAPSLALSKIKDRFNAQIDTLISLKREAIFLDRTANFLPLEGRVFEILTTLPPDEEIVKVKSPGRSDFEWTEEGGQLKLRWNGGLSETEPATVKLSTRRDPENWYALAEEAVDLQFQPVAIAGAEAVSGYLAVAFDPAFQVATETTDGLEPRDGRDTPVKGNLAWFRLEDFSLGLKPSRRPPELEAQLISYALPLANTLEIEGEIRLEILYSGIRDLIVDADPAVSPFLRFQSPLIAQQDRDAESGDWTLTFHEEQSGTLSIRYTLNLPLEVTEVDETEGEKKFQIPMPKLAIPAAKRIRGDWIMEANTDTELTFDTTGLDSVDSLRVPVIRGYQARHRVIAAFQYRGNDWALRMAGTRHPHSELVTTVIDQLEIDTVVSTGGTDRHQARIAVRSAGDQFLELKMPSQSVLWSLAVDGQREKPVRSGRDRLRVQLPAHEDTKQAIIIRVIYATPGRIWDGSGKKKMEPIAVSDRIPVMNSQWRLHLPEGFDYQRFKSNLKQEFSIRERLLMGQVIQDLEKGIAARRYRPSPPQIVTDLSKSDGVISNETLQMPVRPGAANYVLRLQDRVKQADSAAIRGFQLLADNDLEGAIDQYRAALDLLPDAPVTKQRRSAYAKQFAKAATKLARQYADAARYNEAMGLIEEILRPTISPENIDANRLLEQLNDPEYYSPALSPEHLERVRKVKMALKTGQGYLAYGDYDRAEREYHKALNIDRYNSAARRSLEDTERQRMRKNYFDVARDHTRAAFLREIADEWEMPTPDSMSTASISVRENKLKSIRIASIEFSETPLKDALEFLQQKSVELDFNEPDPAKKGINIILQGAGEVANSPITLRLSNVPLGEALRYTASLAQLKYKVEPYAVLVVPLSAPDAELYTNTYTVPPTFLSAAGTQGNGSPPVADPFAPPAGGAPTIQGKMTAKDVLEKAGVSFGPGASAIYNPTTSQLIVRAPPDQLDLVEAYIDSVGVSGPPPPKEHNVITRSEAGENAALSGIRDDDRVRSVEDKLNSIIIPSLEFAETPLTDALDFLQQKAVELDALDSDPNRKGLNIIVTNDGAVPAAAPNAAGGFGFEGGRKSGNGDVASAPITLKLYNIPLGEALRYTTAKANLKYRVEPHAIVVTPLSRPDREIVSYKYQINPEIYDSLVNQEFGPAVADPFSADQPEPVQQEKERLSEREALERMGITFPPGSRVAFDPGSNELTVTNTPDQIDLVEAALSHFSGGADIVDETTRSLDRADYGSFQGLDRESQIPTMTGLSSVGQLFDSMEKQIGNQRELLSKLEIEDLDLRDKTVKEAIDLLENKTGEAIAAHATAPLAFELGEETEESAKKKLDLLIAKATPLEALDQITTASETTYYVTKGGVVVANRETDIQPMETVFIPLPARLFQSVTEEGSIRHIHARNVLQVNGIKFPRGSSAAYNPSTGRLAVRNTRENLEAIVSHFEKDMAALAQNPNAPENDLRFSREFLGGATDLKGFSLGNIGRLPIDFELPESGRVYRFTGLYAPDALQFRYVNWERQIRVAWIWILVGLAGFYFLAWQRWRAPLFCGLAGIVVLSFLPLVVSTGLSTWCNSLLIGWLVGLGFWLVFRLVRAVSAVSLIGILAICSTFVSADDPGEKLIKKHTVYVPYNPERPLVKQSAERYYLDYDTFQGLWNQVKALRQARHPDAQADVFDSGYTLSTALYSISSTPKRLNVVGRLSVSTRGKKWQKVPLEFKGINLSEITIDGERASFQDGAILVEETGSHLVEVKFELPIEEGQDSVAWSIPKSTGVLLEIEMNSDVAEPVLQENWPLAKTSSAEGRTTYTAAIGQREKIEFRRRLKTTGRGMTRPNSAIIDARLFVAQGLEQLEAAYRLNFEGQEENRFTILFEDTFTPVKFDIPNLSVWEIKDQPDSKLRELTFTLTQPVQDSLTVDFTGERTIEESSRVFPELTAEATRIEQQRSLLRADGLAIKAIPGANHRQIPESNASRSSGFIPVAAFSLNGKDEALNYQVSDKRAKRSAEAAYVFQLGSGKLETIAQFQVKSPEEALLNLALTIPSEAKIQAVEGNRIKDWWRTGDELFIRFSGATPEVTAVLIYLTREIADEETATLPVSPFGMKDFEEDEVKGSGLVVAHVTRETSLTFDQNRSVVREVGFDEVSRDTEILAPLERKRGFRFEKKTFSGEISLSQIEPRFDALWVMLARVHESWVRLSVHADIEVTRGGLDRFEFQTDAEVPEFRVLSDDVREVRSTVADGVREYEVVFQRYVTGAISFTMEMELPHGGQVSVPDLDILDATRQEKFLIVENQSAERMDLAPENLDATVISLLPYKPKTLVSAQIFRARRNWNLGVTLENLETSAGNEAVILFAELTSAFRASGEEWLKAVYHIKNRSLQFLPVGLPPGSELVSVIVAGSEVRADKGTVDGDPVVLVPLIQTKPGQLAYDVELVVRSRGNGKSLAKKLRRRLDDPAVYGTTIEKTIWKVHLPAGHKLVDFSGNMQPIDEEESILRKLQSDISELKGLNWLGSQKSGDYETLATSQRNAQVLADIMDNKLKRLSDSKAKLRSKPDKRQQVQDLAELEEELTKQKVVITQNRIEMPQMEQQREPAVIRGKTEGKKVEWDDNSGKIVTRNKDYFDKANDQIRKVESQLRLNDNISVGNTYFGKNIAKPEPKKPAQVQKKTDRLSQIGQLSKNPKAAKVNEKLSALNYSQNMEQFRPGKKEIIKGLKQQKEQLLKKKESIKSIVSNARSKLGRKEKMVEKKPPTKPSPPVPPQLKAPQTRQPPAVVEPDPFGAREMNQNDDPFGGAPAGIPARKAPQTIVVQPQFGQAFKAEGRRSVSVDFPVEGKAHYFQKLKDHAEMKIVSKSTDGSGSKRFPAFLAMLLLLGALFIVRRVRRTINPA